MPAQRGHASGGSSPRVRGTRPAAGAARRSHRFIPARAGNTEIVTATLLIPSVHPRACGEHDKRPPLARPTGGSSPRVRGTQQVVAITVTNGRFIPARAGNTLVGASFTASENGSSPRVRGTLRFSFRRYLRIRFIPARAGNTATAKRCAPLAPVHPRACGEHGVGAAFLFAMVGSSPRVRGTRALLAQSQSQLRFIPARAGNTSTVIRATGSRTVHPRACGEHWETIRTEHAAGGSSPRVRGTPT